MSGLLGNKGPGIMGKLLARNEERYASKEAPGFSGTEKQGKRGNWRSIDKGRDSKRRRGRAGIIASPLTMSVFG